MSRSCSCCRREFQYTLEKSKVKLHPDSDWRERALGTRSATTVQSWAKHGEGAGRTVTPHSPGW